MKIILILLLSIVQIPCVIEGWLSHILNCIVKVLTKIVFLLAIVSFIWWPLDMLCGVCWAGCECLKWKLQGKLLPFPEALVLYMQHYPQV